MTKTKKLMKFSLCFAVFTVTVCLLAGTAYASGTAGSDVPGGEVRSIGELYEALGGEETAVLGDGYVMLRYNVRLKNPLVLLDGNYVIVGAGCSVTADFSDDFMITVGDGEVASTLTVGSMASRADDDAVILDGCGKMTDMGILCVEDGSTLEVYPGTSIRDVVCEAGGGAIHNEGKLMIYGVKIDNCRGNGSGGAIFNRGEAVLTGGNISDCSAEYGGAIYNEGKLKLGGIQIGECTSSKGGAVFNAGTTDLVSSSLSSCTSSEQGGGIYNSNELILSGGQITGATSEAEGGAVYNTGSCTLSGTFITDCRAENGGGIYNRGTIGFTDGIIERCNAAVCGGDVYNGELAEMTFGGGSIYGGEAVYGGGIFNTGLLNIEGGGFSLNKAECGEAILNDGTLNFRKYPYVDFANDVMVVFDEQGSHAVNICSELKAEKIARLTPGIRTDDGYEVGYRDGIILISGERVSEEYGRFAAEDAERPLWYVAKDGTLKKKSPVYMHLWFYVLLVAVYVFVIFAMVCLIRYFKKKSSTKNVK